MASDSTPEDNTTGHEQGATGYSERFTDAFNAADSRLERLQKLAAVIADFLSDQDIDDRRALVEDIIHQDVIGLNRAHAVSIDVLLNDLQWFAYNQAEVPGISADDDHAGPLDAFELRHPPDDCSARHALYDLVGQLYTDAICHLLDERNDDDATLTAVYEAIYRNLRDPRLLMQQEWCRDNSQAIGPEELVTTDSTCQNLTWTEDDAEDIASTLIQSSTAPEVNLNRFPTSPSEWDHPSASLVESIVNRVDGETDNDSSSLQRPSPSPPDNLELSRFEEFTTRATESFTAEIGDFSGSALALAEQAAERTLDEAAHAPRDAWVTAIAEGVQQQLSIGDRDGTPVYLDEWDASLSHLDDGRLVIDGSNCPVCGSCIVNATVGYGAQFVGSSPSEDYDYHLDDGGWDPEVTYARCGTCQTELVTNGS
jgi:hypothetical protein